MDLESRITIDPNVRFGKACVRGTRITAGDVLGYLASGMSEAEIRADFPVLTREDIRASPVNYIALCGACAKPRVAPTAKS